MFAEMVTASLFRQVASNFMPFTFLNCCREECSNTLTHSHICPSFRHIQWNTHAPKTEKELFFSCYTAHLVHFCTIYIFVSLIFVFRFFTFLFIVVVVVLFSFESHRNETYFGQIVHVSHHKVRALHTRHCEKWTTTTATETKKKTILEMKTYECQMCVYLQYIHHFSQIHHYHSRTFHLLCHIR